MKPLLWILLALTLVGCGSGKKELHLYTWAELIDAEAIIAFEKKYNCRVVVDNYDSNETLYAKLKSGAGGYDVIVPTWYYVQVLDKQGMLKKLDISKIPNAQFLDERYLKPLGKGDLSTSFPFAISTQGIGYRADRVREAPDSWTIFGDKAYRKRMTLMNDLREVIGAALMVLGYSPNTVNPAEIAEATKICLVWRDTIAKFDSEQYKGGIATGEFLIVQAFSGDLMQVNSENPNVRFSYPKEGVIVSYDMLCIPKGAREVDLAHAFINFLFQPEIAASTMERVFELIPNTAAYPMLPEHIRENPGIFPPEEVWQRFHVLEDLGPALKLYADAWTRIKDG